jgi:hypothetical protein
MMKRVIEETLEFRLSSQPLGLTVINKNIKEKLNLNLEGKDGNAFALLGYFQKEARKANWSQEEIKKVIDKATSGDYDNLLQTLLSV